MNASTPFQANEIIHEMAARSQTGYLTLEEFDRLYSGEKPYHEYWDGQAIQKPMPTVLHSLQQWVLINLLREVGLVAGGEIRLKLSQTRQPLPDVIAGNRLQHPYLTKPFAVAIEWLESGDWPSIPVQRIWDALDRELEKVDFSDSNR